MRRLVLALLFAGSLPLWAAPAQSELFSEAESRYLGRNYTAALEAYDALLSAYPLSDLSADVQYRRAVCMYRLQRYRDALQLLEEIDKRYRSTRYIDYLPFWRGLSLYQLGSFSLAQQGLDAFLAARQDPELSPQALLYKSLSRIGLKDYEGAIPPLQSLVRTYRSSEVFPYASVLLSSLLKKQKAIEALAELTGGIDPAGFPAPWKEQFRLYRADALWETNRAPEAEAIYRSLTDAPPEVALAAYRRLVVAAQNRQDLQGMQALTRAAEARFAATPDLLTDLWTRIGLESYRQGSLSSAELFLQRVWSLRASQPVNEIVPLYLAEILLARKDPAAARKLLEEYAGQSPGSPSVVMRLGDIALQVGDLAAAEGYYARFASSFAGSPRAPEAGYFLAYVKYRMGKRDDALALSARLLQDTPGYRPELLRLRAALLKKSGDLKGAAAALAEVAAARPQDPRAEVDLLKELFALRDSARLLQEADGFLKRFPALRTSDPYAFLLASYLRGLGLTGAKEYAAAIRDLQVIGREQAEAAGIGIIYPYAGYYLSWAYVKTGAFDRATAVLDGLAQAFPRHELTEKILFLSGWCRFSLGDFERAAALFSRTARIGGDAELAQRSAYLYAKSLLNAKKLPEATVALQTILHASPPSPFADSAQFDYAGILEQTGSFGAAADAYLALSNGFPGSPLAEEALYSRAETYQTHGMFGEAKGAFTEYRRRFPKGKMADAALYWGGEAAAATKEKFAAVLLWEQLVQQFRSSSFRAAALRKTADVYRDSRDFAKALALYTQLIAEYPEEARAAKADIAAEQVRYQMSGLGDKEAELTARVAGARGPAKAAAMVELARMYILGGESKAEQGYQMLPQITALGDPASTFQAQYLAGEYFYRKGDLGEAGKRFLAAAVGASSAPDSAASAVYRAAEMMKLAGRAEEVKALVKRLQDSFPSSAWTAKGRALLEASR